MKFTAYATSSKGELVAIADTETKSMEDAKRILARFASNIGVDLVTVKSVNPIRSSCS